MTTNTEYNDVTDGSEYTPSFEEGTTQNPSVPPTDDVTEGRPLPGMDILKVVYDEAVRRAEIGMPPTYAFLRIDIYLMTLAANAATGVMNWVDANSKLNCYLLPFWPGEGQSPFVLANNYDEAYSTLIGSYPAGTFQSAPVEETAVEATSDDGDSEAVVVDGCPVLE